MNIIIPMAGLGKRMRPHTLTTAKPLLPIAGKPMVHRLVEDITRLAPEKVDHIGFIIHPSFGKQVEADLKQVAQEVGAIGKIFYQEEAKGISHALLFAGELFTGKVIVAFADTLFKEGRLEKPVKSSDIYMGSIPWVIMQLILVVIVIFVPETVTMFLDKEVQVDLDKVVIEMPTEQDVPEAELKPGNSADEQKRMEELFKK